MNENQAPQEPQDESDLSTLNDDELDAASGGKGALGDQVIIAETVNIQGVIA